MGNTRLLGRVQSGATCAVIGAIAASTSWGCQMFVDPFLDEMACQPPVTTPSVEGVLTANLEERVVPHRGTPIVLRAKEGTVTHTPLYFEDPFEDKGSDDGQFAVTGEDYLQVFYWRGRFLLNTIFFPVSVLVTPPWTLMASDGVLSEQALGKDHDAERWRGETGPGAWPIEPDIVSTDGS